MKSAKAKRKFLDENDCEYLNGLGWYSAADGHGGHVENTHEEGVFLGRNATDAYNRFCDLNEG